MGCGQIAPGAETTTASRPERFSLVGMERVVPVRWVLVQPDAQGAFGGYIADWRDIEGTTQVTNQAFRNGGVQFQVSSISRAVVPALAANSGACDNTQVSWSTVKNDLAQIFPVISSLPAGSLPPAATQYARWSWLLYAASRFAPPEELTAFIFDCGTAAGGTPPWSGRSFGVPASLMGDWWKVTHEFGHIFGIFHSDAEGSPDSTDANQHCLPSSSVACNPYTSPALGMTTLADHWSHVYLPGLAGFYNPPSMVTIPHRTFSSRYDASLVNPSELRWIDDGIPDGSGNRCSVDRSGTGRMQCTMPGRGSPATYWEFWDTDAAISRKHLRGYMWDTGEPTKGMALMSYRLEPASNRPDWPAGFSDSQAELVRQNLRYDTPITDPSTRAATEALTGGRPLLGRALRRRPLDKLDFDGDGKRDIAAYFPPLVANTLGKFLVYTSKSNYASQNVYSFGGVGDVPVPADYNGDGITDFATLVSPAGYDDAQPLVWQWCLSSPGVPAGQPATHSCANPGTYGWGIRGDVPIPGTRFSPTSPSELTVYRPSTATVYTTVPGVSWISRPLGLTAAESGGTPFVAPFDGDASDDIGFYNPKTAQFSLWRSPSNWATRENFAFCPGGPATCPYVAKATGTAANRAGAVPVWGLAQMVASVPANGTTRAAGALGLWDLSSGTWNVMWTPLSSSTVTVNQWGDPRDIVVADAVGLRSAGASAELGKRSNLVAYRSASTDGPASLYRCAYTAAGTSCPTGAYQDIVVPGGQSRDLAFAVSDMVGDGMPELCTFDPEGTTWGCYTSDSGYSTVIWNQFWGHGGPYSTSAQFL